MPTSAEIAQQISDQNNWFMQQNAMASQIGMSPAAYGGGGQVMPGHPAMAPMPGAFSYGMPNQMAWGNRAGAAMAAAGAATPLIGSALGGSSAMFNPISGFMLARGAGLGVGASMGAAGAMLAPMALAAYGVNLGVQGIQQQAGLQHAVSNYSFANPAAMSGQGFSRQDAMAIGRQVRQLSNVPELMTSFEEITRILPQLKTMGMMQGVRDAAEFGKRMKEAIVTVREISKVLGTTMEEATQFFANSRGLGFFGGRDAVQNAMNSRVTMSLTGMNAGQVMQMQQQGAALGTAIGGSRRLGAEGVTNIANQIGLAAQGNAALQETIANITGKTGAEGIQEAAGMFANIGVRMAGTNAGRYLMAGMMKVDENGRVGLDENLMAQQRRGGLSMEDIRARGMRNMGNRDFVKKFERNQTELAQQFAAQHGPQGIAQLLYGAFGGDEDAAAIVMQNQYGLTEQQTNMTLGLMREEGTGVGQEKRLVQQMIQRNIKRRERAPGSVMSRMGRALAANTTEPLRQGGADLANRLSSTVDELKQDIAGDFVLQLSQDVQKEVVDMMSSPDVKGKWKKAFMDGAQVDRLAKTGGSRSDSLFSVLAGGVADNLGLWGSGSNRSLTSMTSELMGYSGSGSLATLATDVAEDSGIVPWFQSIGTTGTGRTARGALRKYAGEFGLGAGATQAGLQSRLEQMTGSDFWTGTSAKPTDAMEAAARQAADVIKELSTTDEYADATEQKKYEMATEAIRKRVKGDGRLDLAILKSKTGSETDINTMLWAGAQRYLKGSGVEANLQEFGNLGAAGTDPTAIAQNLRDAEYRLGDLFGQDAAAGLKKSAAARDVMSQLYAEKDPGKRQALVAAVQSGNKAKIEELTGQKLSTDDLTTLKQAYRSGKEWASGRDDTDNLKALQGFGKWQGAASSLALRETGKEMKDQISEAFRGDDSNIAKLMGNVGSAAEKVDGPGFQKAVDAAAEAIEKLSPEERAKVEAKLPPAMQAALARRTGAKSGLKSLVNKGHGTLAEVAKAVGLSEDKVRDALSLHSAKSSDTIALDADKVELLKKTAGEVGAATVFAGSAEANNQKAVANEQMVLLRTMTQAIVNLGGGEDKLDEATRKAYNATKLKVADADKAASPTPGKKGP